MTFSEVIERVSWKDVKYWIAINKIREREDARARAHAKARAKAQGH